MPLKSPLILGFALALAAIVPVAVAQTTVPAALDPAIAAMTHEQLVKLRQDTMEQNGRILRGAGSLSGEQAVAAATQVLQNFSSLPDLFREGSIAGNSRALPTIWENWDDFRSRFEHDAELAATMLAAAESGDTAAYSGAIKGITDSCGGCHMTYRTRR